MARAPARLGDRGRGLPGLRRAGAVSELLFLYECLVLEPTQLRPVADRLGLTVQAASHTFRGLARRGLAEVRDGRYRATVRGVAWLHGTLGDVAEDLKGRLGRLHVIRATRAIAATDLEVGAMVSLELSDGLLTARAGGDGPSKGRTGTAARAGELVEVVALEGIVPLPRATVQVVTVADPISKGAQSIAAVERALRDAPMALLAAPGLEGYHLLRKATERPIVRFAVAAVCAEASRVGVPSFVLLTEDELPRFLAPFDGPDPPPISVERLRGGSAPAPKRRVPPAPREGRGRSPKGRPA